MSIRPTSVTSTTKNSIPESLTDLVAYLSQLTERASMEKLDELLNGTGVDLAELKPFMNFGDKTYRRNLICQSEWFELLCICWKSGQRSPIHNHANSTCGLRIIEGVCTETLFESTDCGQIKAVASNDCGEGHVCCSQDADVHQVSNLQGDDKCLVTLHIYSPPLRMMDTYSLMGETETYIPQNFMSCHFADGI